MFAPKQHAHKPLRTQQPTNQPTHGSKANSPALLAAQRCVTQAGPFLPAPTPPPSCPQVTASSWKHQHRSASPRCLRPAPCSVWEQSHKHKPCRGFSSRHSPALAAAIPISPCPACSTGMKHDGSNDHQGCKIPSIPGLGWSIACVCSMGMTTVQSIFREYTAAIGKC